MKATHATAIPAVALLALLAPTGSGYCADKAQIAAAQAVQYVEGDYQLPGGVFISVRRGEHVLN